MEMKSPIAGKVGALGAVVLALWAGLGSIGDVVHERQGRQRAAEQSVEDALAGAQLVLGPALERRCVEVWQAVEGSGKDRREVEKRREFVLTAWPHKLDVQGSAELEPRYRGLFKVNSYQAELKLAADWADAAALQPRAENVGGQLRCEAPTMSVALGDARGILSATVQLSGQPLPVQPGSLLAARSRGLHARLPELAASAPLHLDVALSLAGTRSLSWVPIAADTRVQLRSEWPHPSFGGRFLPLQRDVGDAGFEARWQISSLATSAQTDAARPVAWCEPNDGSTEGVVDGRRGACIDSFGVGFIDPVNGYVLSDRAVKYGMLFIGLTFVGVGLVELLRRLRVHPMQYLLVGCALTVFFLLLLSLSEHVPFGWAYLAASAACNALLGYYASHVLGGWRAGTVFGLLVAALYGVLYALLQLEQTALVLGALLLFAVLAAVMVATRRLDWYALAASWNTRPAA